EMGSAFVVVTDNQPTLAAELAERLSQSLMERRELMRGRMIAPEDAIARIPGAAKPVGLLDMGDNAGGGAPGDSTFLARMCQEARVGRTLLYVPDSESVEACHAAGIGGR